MRYHGSAFGGGQFPLNRVVEYFSWQGPVLDPASRHEVLDLQFGVVEDRWLGLRVLSTH